MGNYGLSHAQIQGAKSKHGNHQKLLLLCTILMVIALACSACGKIQVNTDTGGEASEVLSEQSEDERSDSTGTPDTSSAVSDKANLFICGEPSMMGFADWKNDTMYETTVSLLLDRLNAYAVKLYRYDKYNIAADGMLLPDAAALKKAVREPSFYTAEGLSAESSIPASVTRYKNDRLGNLKGINAYFSAEALETAGTGTEYPLDNAIRLFDKNALNIVVTDLYELRNGGFARLSELSGYDVGVLAVRSEYAGSLPALASDGASVAWGSPRTGGYKSHAVKKASYTKTDGTTGYYNYNVFSAYGAEDRVSDSRTFYIIFAGNAENIGGAMGSLRSKIVEKYANSSSVTPELGVFGFFSAPCEDIKADDASTKGYIVYADDELVDGAYSYEFRETDDVAALRMTAKYPMDTGAGAVIPAASDFDVKSTCNGLGKLGKEYDFKPVFMIEQGGSGYVTPVLTYDTNDLEKGEYMFETTVSVKATEQATSKAEFLDKWGIEIDDGTLRQILSAYKGGSQDGKEKMRDVMLKTQGLGYLFEYVKEPPKVTEILKIKVYIKVV